MSDEHTALCDAEAIGDTARYEAIMQAIKTRSPLPPLPADVVIPPVVQLPYPGAW